MSHATDHRLDWTAAATPQGERVLPSLSRPARPRATPQSRSSVMETLLGENQLSASEVGGNDPYNATGRHFRR
jgi:hypothetical protein